MKPKSSRKYNLPKLIASTNSFPLVGIGASAGGLEAFRNFVKAIPENSGIAYVCVQHLDPSHQSALPELLQKVSSIPVVEISDNIKVETNRIYVIPSNKIMVANDGVLQLAPRPPISDNYRNLPIDLFFASMAEVYQTKAIGIVLSGTAGDGTIGLKAIKAHGGMTMAQDEATALYPNMPHSAIEAGVVDYVLPPEQMPQKIIEVIQHVESHEEQDLAQMDEQIFKQIISVLRIRKGTDFTYYKKTTIHRRIFRRMALTKQEDSLAYLKFLRDNKEEQDILYQDLLIPVSEFFRDPPIFDNLCETVFPRLEQNKAAGDPTRIWVAGCSTGQEAYSIAMCFKEFLGNRQEKVQIFATDISEPAIAKARSGIYSKSEIATVSPERLHEFFTKTTGGYLINKELRDMCVFAVHNFLKDPPFSKMDFISCRNVLIYMESYLQKKALTTFHYSLNPKGILLLGKTETTSSVPELYDVAVKSDKLFLRKDVPGRFMPVASIRSEKYLSNIDNNQKKETISNDFQKIADEVILKSFTPAGVIVNEMLDIVHFRGNTSIYWEQLSGKPTHNLLKMARQGLAFELRNILHKVRKEKTAVRKDHIPLQANGNLYYISIDAIPLPNTIESYYLILFHENSSAIESPLTGAKQGLPTGWTKTHNKDLRIHQLEEEIKLLRDDMRMITEDQEAANEELQSANEELLSGSEELQSLNEELETSKEELQSTNEELMIVNQELVTLNEQLTEARNYAEAIIANGREPLIVLDKNLRIKTANLAYYHTFQLDETEVEGKLIYEVDNKQWNIPALKELLEKILPKKSILKNFEITHTFANLGERIMLLNARELVKDRNSEKLILLVIEDITEQKKAQQEQKQVQKRLQFIADSMPQKVWTADEKGNLDYFNKMWLNYTGLTFEGLKSEGWKKIIHPNDWQEYKKRWQYSIETKNDFELEHRLLNKDNEYQWHLSRGIAYKNETGDILMWVGTNTEIHEHKEEKEKLEREVEKRTSELKQLNDSLETKNYELMLMNQELHSFTYVVSHDLQEPLRKIQAFANRLLDKETNNLSDAGKEYFKRMQTATERMQRLITDLLAFSRINTTDRKFEHTSLHTIVEEVVAELKETIDEKNAIIEIGKLCSADIISFQFRQLMYNLLGNALKFSKPNTQIHITIKSRIEKGSKLNIESDDSLKDRFIMDKKYCHISVSDNGIGFEQNASHRIFEVFQRLHGRAEYAGTGIGLSIVKKIVENHNGFISATSQLNQGATFDIYIPQM